MFVSGNLLFWQFLLSLGNKKGKLVLKDGLGLFFIREVLNSLRFLGSWKRHITLTVLLSWHGRMVRALALGWDLRELVSNLGSGRYQLSGFGKIT